MAAFAFFDVDGTLINSRSLVGFLPHLRPLVPARRFETYWQGLRQRVWERVAREQLNRFYFRILEDLPQAQVAAMGRDWFEAASREATFFHAEGLGLLKALQAQGLQVCLVTGSFRELVTPLAEAVGAQAVLCTEPEVESGRFTGRLVGEPCIGAGKVDRVRAFADRHGVDLAACVAVGDDDSDRPLLALVGQGRMVVPEAAYAAELATVFGTAPAWPVSAPAVRGVLHA